LRSRGVVIHGVGVMRGVVLLGLLGRRVLLLHGGVLGVGEGTLWRHAKTVAILGPAGAMLLLHRQLLRRRGREVWAPRCTP
jgi:hypothetical protein